MIYDKTLHEIVAILNECERLLDMPGLIESERGRISLEKCKAKIIDIIEMRQDELIEKRITNRWPGELRRYK